MPKRQRIKQHPCDEVQGEDSWVKIKSPEYGLIIEAMEMMAESEQEDAGSKNQKRSEALKNLAQAELGERILGQAIVEWNWVKDDGTPMPQYDPESWNARKITLDEVMFLLDLVLGDSKRKN